VENHLASDAASNVTAEAERLAERIIRGVLAGDQKLAEQAFQISSYQLADPRFSFITDASKLRFQLVEAFPVLLQNAALADALVLVKAQAKEIESLREQLNCRSERYGY
jgi:hypothetical protein